MGRPTRHMEPPTSNTPTKLRIRAYACKVSARTIKAGLQKLAETSPAFNESWLNGEFVEGTRIGGLTQHGDIIVRHRTSRRRHELTIEHRAGDEPLALEIEAAFARHLTPKAPRLVAGGKRPEGLAYFFEMIRACPLRRRITIADAVIEEAHDLQFDDYREARAKLEFLSMLSRLHDVQGNLDVRIQKMYAEANERQLMPKVCLYEGRKVFLEHRIDMVSKKHDYVLILHFAKLMAGRVLVGWVEEKRI